MRTRRFTILCWIYLPMIAALVANTAVGQEPRKDYAKDFQQSFKGMQPNPKDLKVFGPDADKLIRFEPEGMRITLPTGYAGERPNIGIVTRFALHGDFEITLDYELLQEPVPADVGKTGTRLTLMIVLNTPASNMATFSRKASARGSEYIAWRSISKELDGPTQTGSKVFTTTSKSGRLRLVRRAATLFYYVAEGAEPEFKLLDTFPIREEDLKEVRIFGTTGGEKAALDVRIANLRIRADALPARAANPPPLSPPNLADRVEFRFRDGISKQPMLHLVEQSIAEMAVIDPQGLRLNLPANREYRGDVGIEARMRLKGDFEITLEYELLLLPSPGPKLGAGAVLQVLLDSPDEFKARMGRSRRTTGAVFGANYIIRKPDGKNHFQGLSAPSGNDKQTKGHLRLTRIGKKLFYQVEEGGTGFRTIATYTTKQAEPPDVIAIQLLCATGWEGVPLEVRYPLLDLRASAIPDKANVVAPRPEAPDVQATPTPIPAVPAVQPAFPAQTEAGVRPIILFVIGLGAILSIAMIMGLALLLRKRAGATIVPASRVFQCPECGKKVKVKPESADKKFKCPQCSVAMVAADRGDK